MAKKTIGQFIATLRKAKGLTQQDVADYLNVSNKTVSRWERDACAPDLTLIPALAEMFDVTCDELLKGEKNSPNDNGQKTKADKQFKALLSGRIRKYHNLTLLAIELTICGLSAALIANLAFAKGLIAFILVTILAITSEICQLCFAKNAYIILDEETNDYYKMITKANTSIVKKAIIITFINVLVVSFCLPLVTLIDGTNFGLSFQSWLGYGLLYSIISFLILYLIYVLIIRKILIRLQLLIYNETEKTILVQQKHLLKKTMVISFSIAFLLVIGIFILNTLPVSLYAKKEVFTSTKEFKTQLEQDYDDYLLLVPEANKEYQEIKNSNGDIICSYYYSPDLYFNISFNESSNDKTPIIVITIKASQKAFRLKENIESSLYMLISLNFLIATGIYIIKAIKIKKQIQ